jgi:hypothetical protein
MNLEAMKGILFPTPGFPGFQILSSVPMSVLGIGVDLVKKDEFGSHETMKGNLESKGQEEEGIWKPGNQERWDESGRQENRKWNLIHLPGFMVSRFMKTNSVSIPTPGFLASRLVLCLVP